MRILTLSDTILPYIYSPQVKRRFHGTDLIIGCGDLAYYYLEYLIDSLNVPLFFVRGNHDEVIEYSTIGQRTHPHGGVDLHSKTIKYGPLILAGVEGSLRYRPGPFQYTQSEMWGHVLRLTPALIYNRARHGRYMDIFITHAPAAGIHDDIDLPHQGISAFRWLIKVFQPRYYFHGHIHVYRPDTVVETQVGLTKVLNTYGYRETQIE